MHQVPAHQIDPFGEYAYRQVADDIARRIEAGEIMAKLPSERDLADEYGVAYATVRRAMTELRERGADGRHAGHIRSWDRPNRPVI